MHRVYRIQFTSGGNEIKRNESSSLTSLTALFLFASQEALQEKRRRQGTRMDGEMAPVKLLKQPPGKLLRKRFRKVRAAVEPEVTVVAATSWARVNLQQSVAKCLSGKWLQKKHKRKVGKNNEKKNHPSYSSSPLLGNAFVFNEFLSVLTGAIFHHGENRCKLRQIRNNCANATTGDSLGTSALQLQLQFPAQTCSI